MNFNNSGVLDQGIHKMTWREFYDSFSFSKRRKELLEGLEKVVAVLQKTEATHIYIDGSFVTNKLEPGDWDACFDYSEERIFELETKYGYPLLNRRLQKSLYKGELFYAYWEADGYGNKYLEFFQQLKHSTDKKGIIEIIL